MQANAVQAVPKTNVIYRVQHQNNSMGPFAEFTNLDIDPDWDATAHCNFPTPTQDGMTWNKDYYCGFSSLAQYHLWFSVHQKALLKKHGFVLYEYEITPDSNYQAGEFQCVFLKDKSKVLAKHDVFDFEHIKSEVDLALELEFA